MSEVRTDIYLNDIYEYGFTVDLDEEKVIKSPIYESVLIDNISYLLVDIKEKKTDDGENVVLYCFAGIEPPKGGTTYKIDLSYRILLIQEEIELYNDSERINIDPTFGRSRKFEIAEKDLYEKYVGELTE